MGPHGFERDGTSAPGKSTALAPMGPHGFERDGTSLPERTCALARALARARARTGTRTRVRARTRLLLAPALIALAACTPTPQEAAASIRVALERGSKEPDAAFLDALTPASRTLVERVTRAGGYPSLRDRLMAALKNVRPGTAEGLVVGADGSTLFFVRDGHGRRLDLALSDPAFASLREARYPVPW